MRVSSAGRETPRAGGRVDRPEPAAADIHEEEKDADDEGRVADPVDQEGLHAGLGRRRPLEPEADQEIGAKPDALPADEHQDDVRGQDQHEHEEGEQVQEGEVSGIALVFGHVSDRIDVDEQADARDDQGHDGGQLVELERDGGPERAADDPVEERLRKRIRLDAPAGQLDETGHGKPQGEEDGAAGLPADPATGQAAAGEHQDERARPGQERDEPEEFGHASP